MQLERITISPVWSYTFQFAFWSLLLFGLVYIDNFSPLAFINQAQTQLSTFLTNLWVTKLDLNITMKGSYLLYDHGLSLHITNECNGLAAYILCLAAIISFPTQQKTKVLWGISSYFILLIANSVRLDWIAYHVIENPDDFIFAHEVLGRYIYAFVALMLFFLFTSYASINKHTDEHTFVTQAHP